MSLDPTANVVAYVPARLGSNRVQVKNLRLLRGLPLMHYVLKTLQNVRNIDHAYLNTESDIIAKAANGLIDVYKRPAHLATSTVNTDEILYDFAKNIPSKSIAVINPTAPFLTAATVENTISIHLKNNRETVFTTTEQKKHLVYRGSPVNFTLNRQSPRTQDLESFQYINFISFVISSEHVIRSFEKNGYCLYVPPLHFSPMQGIECHDIDDEDDFRIAEAIILRNESTSIEYDNSISDAIKSGKNFKN